jgi:hypothetical protein
MCSCGLQTRKAKVQHLWGLSACDCSLTGARVHMGDPTVLGPPTSGFKPEHPCVKWCTFGYVYRSQYFSHLREHIFCYREAVLQVRSSFISSNQRSLGQNLRLTNLLNGNHIYDFLKLERWDATTASKTGGAQNLGFELFCSPLRVGVS